MAISANQPLGLSPVPQINSGFVDQFQEVDPQLLLLLQQVLQMSGGDSSGSYLSPNSQFGNNPSADGGGGSGSGGFAPNLGDFLGRCIDNSGGGAAPIGNTNTNTNSNGSAPGGWVGGGDSYVPGGLEATDRGGVIGNNNQGATAVSWAESQLGVSEARNPNTVRGYSRGNWQAWCADFVSTALNKAGANRMGHQSSVAGILGWGKANGRFTSAKAAAANPSSLQLGDIATWKSAGKSHVGLVTGVDAKKGTFTTIEGNTSDKVARRTHSFTERGLTGFVRATDSKRSTATASASASSRSGSSSSKSGSTGGSSSSGGGKSGSSSSSKA